MAEGTAHEGKIRRVKRILYPLVKIIAYAGSSAEGYPKEIKIFFFLFLIDKSEFGGDRIMRTYENKDELKNEINKSFVKYISEFNDIPESLKDKRLDEVDRTPAENLAYQIGWTTLVLKWEADEKKGIDVKTPSDNFKWNQLGELYQWFTDTYAQLSLQELKDRLNENINSIYAMIDSLSEEELFKPHMRKWADEATKTAVWEVYKFIHINTVAPFGTFRTKIRKWKKIAL